MQDIEISVVIPLFNEEENIKPLLLDITKKIKATSSIHTYEIIVVDDGSTDHTKNELIDAQKLYPNLSIIGFRRNLGKSVALSEGFKRAKGEIIITMDGDLQDDAVNLTTLLLKLNEGFDMVIGWRQDRQDKKGKVILSTIFNHVVRAMSGVKLHDFNSGLKAMRLQVTKEILLYGEMHRYIPVLAVQKGFKVTEIPVTHNRRYKGISKYGFNRTFKGFFDLLTVLFLHSYSHRPLHLFGAFGLFSIFIGMLFGMYLSAMHFSGYSIGTRPLLTLSVLLIIAGLQVIIIGFIAELVVNRSSRYDIIPIAYEYSKKRNK